MSSNVLLSQFGSNCLFPQVEKCGALRNSVFFFCGAKRMTTESCVNQEQLYFLWQCCWLRSKCYVLSCVSLASGSPQVKTFELDETACAVNLVAIQYNFDFNHICFWFSLWYCISWLFDFISCSSAVGMWHWQFYGMLDAICASQSWRQNRIFLL